MGRACVFRDLQVEKLGGCFRSEALGDENIVDVGIGSRSREVRWVLSLDETHSGVRHHQSESRLISALFREGVIVSIAHNNKRGVAWDIFHVFEKLPDSRIRVLVLTSVWHVD